MDDLFLTRRRNAASAQVKVALPLAFALSALSGALLTGWLTIVCQQPSGHNEVSLLSEILSTGDLRKISLVVASSANAIPEIVEVRQGQGLELTVTAPVDDQVHLHGYDLEEPVSSNQSALITSTASQSGRFAVELEEREAVIGYLEVLPQ